MGKAKTRIATTLGDEAALSIYIRLLQITREVVDGLDGIARFLFYSDEINHSDPWSNAIYSKHLQSDGDLGDRMSKAFATALDTCDQVIIIGSDCPYIDGDIINQAFVQLDDNDVVIGPTFDGGYYLLGMKSQHAALFENMPWSTDQVYPMTVQIIEKMQLDYWVGPKLNDIDHAEDWSAYLVQK